LGCGTWVLAMSHLYSRTHRETFRAARLPRVEVLQQPGPLARLRMHEGETISEAAEMPAASGRRGRRRAQRVFNT